MGDVLAQDNPLPDSCVVIKVFLGSQILQLHGGLEGFYLHLLSTLARIFRFERNGILLGQKEKEQQQFLVAHILPLQGLSEGINGIASRNKKIADQLEEAAKIHEEMQSLNKKHDEMMAQAKAERDAILVEARKVSEEMYEKTKLKASAESQAMIEDAKKAIYFEKMKAITDAKNAIANFSIDIAQKVIAEELKDREKQEALVEKWLEDCHFN